MSTLNETRWFLRPDYIHPVDTSGDEGRVKSDDVTLLLNIVASSEQSSVKSNKRRTAGTSRHRFSMEKRDVLKIKFRSEDGEFAFVANLIAQQQPTGHLLNFRILRF